MVKTAVIVGAGPAGLTAALELLRRTDITPIVLEGSHEIGGISRTIRYKGNRMDIGGHRFFSKSDRVMQWWTELLPPDLSIPGVTVPGNSGSVPVASAAETEITYRGKRRIVGVPARLPEEPPLRGLGPLDPDTQDQVPNLAEDGQTAGDQAVGTVVVPMPANSDLVMLIRPRRSRIYYLRKFFDYPITLTTNTIRTSESRA